MENNHLIQLSALQVNIHHEIKVLLAPLSLQTRRHHHMALLLSKQEASLMKLNDWILFWKMIRLHSS
jgi:hypothetical protein